MSQQNPKPPSQRAAHQAEALGRQLMNTLLSLCYEGLETGNTDLTRAAYASVRWEEHANPAFRKMLLQYLKVRLFTFTSPNPVLMSRLVPFQWVEVLPGDLAYVQAKIKGMREDLATQMSELLAEYATEEQPE